ncbi:MAG: nuclear transport factor 2 family protein [Gammaproteobacteria bacterium]
MYAAIVRHKLLKIFAALSRGESGPMVDSLAARFEYRFEGDSPIGGLRTEKESIRLWWARLYRLFPGLSFEVREVAVVGPPWNTRIHVLMDFVVPHTQAGADRPYRNVVMQFMRMRWGKVWHIHTLEDTERCARYLAWAHAQGRNEARAGAISDRPWPDPGPFMAAQASATSPQPA